MRLYCKKNETVVPDACKGLRPTPLQPHAVPGHTGRTATFFPLRGMQLRASVLRVLKK